MNFVMDILTRSIFLLTVMISSATGEREKNLTGTEGGSITLPDPVVEFGFLLFGGKNIVMVNKGELSIFVEIYKNKVLWNNNTGLFTITRLQRKDSGIYIIDSKEGRGFITFYKLTVYDSVPTPAVTEVNVSAESCSLLCSVEKAEETTLSWYKDEVRVNHSSSALSLPLTVHKQEFNSSYRCVAANPAENKTLPVNVTASCSGEKKINKGNRDRQYIPSIVVPIVLAVLVLLVAFTIKCKYDKNKRTTRHSEGRVSEQGTGRSVH
ncbi:CD48 antigen-like isoform 2-T2 [Symphorus nematophorus]